jgi:hypothetical protein
LNPAVSGDSGCRHVGQDALEGASARLGHDRVALHVVPDQPHRLLKCPGLAAFLFEIVASEVVAKDLPWTGFQQVPGGNEIQRGIGGFRATDVDDPG